MHRDKILKIKEESITITSLATETLTIYEDGSLSKSYELGDSKIRIKLLNGTAPNGRFIIWTGDSPFGKPYANLKVAYSAYQSVFHKKCITDFINNHE